MLWGVGLPSVGVCGFSSVGGGEGCLAGGSVAGVCCCFFLVHGGCPPASITQKRPNHGQVSVHGEPKFIQGQQPYVQ